MKYIHVKIYMAMKERRMFIKFTYRSWQNANFHLINCPKNLRVIFEFLGRFELFGSLLVSRWAQEILDFLDVDCFGYYYLYFISCRLRQIIWPWRRQYGFPFLIDWSAICHLTSKSFAYSFAYSCFCFYPFLFNLSNPSIFFIFLYKSKIF